MGHSGNVSLSRGYAGGGRFEMSATQEGISKNLDMWFRRGDRQL